MGLDMYGYTMCAEFAGNRQTDVNVREDEVEQAQLKDIAYWRKFNHLHGWMEDLYREKGGTDVYTPGFFFGDDEIYPEDITETKAFIEKARAAIAAGLAVFYDSWW